MNSVRPGVPAALALRLAARFDAVVYRAGVFRHRGASADQEPFDIPRHGDDPCSHDPGHAQACDTRTAFGQRVNVVQCSDMPNAGQQACGRGTDYRTVQMAVHDVDVCPPEQSRKLHREHRQFVKSAVKAVVEDTNIQAALLCRALEPGISETPDFNGVPLVDVRIRQLDDQRFGTAGIGRVDEHNDLQEPLPAGSPSPTTPVISSYMPCNSWK